MSTVRTPAPHARPSHPRFSSLDINVTGTSSGKVGKVVVDLECSAECYDITATGTNLTSPKGQAVYYCKNVASETALDFACTAPPS